MKRLWAFRVWHGVVSVPVAAGVGVMTNLATEEFSWALTCGLVAFVLMQAGLSVRQAVEDQQGLRDARDELLRPLRPPVPPSPVADESPVGRDGSVLQVGAVVGWLTAPFTPTPLWGRSGMRDRLVAWCVASASGADVVRVVTGPAGVGKSRLALAVAAALPAGWVAGRLRDDAAGLVERIAAAGDRTLVIVDDTESVAVSAVETLVAGAVRHPDLIRVLLLARTDAALRLLPDEVRPRLAGVEVLGPVGEAEDRQRWFVEAARAYAREWRVPAPDLPDRPVGTDGDTPLMLHARALLAVLGRSDIRTWSLTDLMTELVSLEQRSWQSDLPRLPAGCDTEVLAEALAVLLLLPASGTEEAAELLRRVPQFSHDTAQESRVAVARWARRRYPPGRDHRPDLQPHLVGERLVLDILTRTPNLLHDDDIPAAASVLTFAYATFRDARAHLTAPLIRRPDLLPDALTSVLATGVTGRPLDLALSSLIDPHCVDVDLRIRLIALDRTTALPHLRLALTRLHVEHFQMLVEAQPDNHRPELATSLNDLGIDLRDVGRSREALTVVEQAVAIRRELAEAEPDRYRPALADSLIALEAFLGDVGRWREALTVVEQAVAIRRELAEAEPDRYRPALADSLNNLGVCLSGVGRPREALTAVEQAVVIKRELAVAEPDRYRPELGDTLHTLGICLSGVGRPREALTAVEQAVAIRRELAAAEPDRYRPGLAGSLSNLGIYLAELGQPREALTAVEQAVAIRRELAAAEPDRYRPGLAGSLSNLGDYLAELGRPQEALTAVEQAVAIRRELAAAEPDRYRPDLAASLINLSMRLSGVGRPQEALTAVEQAVAIVRKLATVEPDRYRPDLAASLDNLGACLSGVGRPQKALTAVKQAVAIKRELAAAEPDRYRPDLATLLNNLAVGFAQVGDLDGALRAKRDMVAVWRACADQDPELYEPIYQREAAKLRRQLNQAGHHEEAVAPDPGRAPDTDSTATS
ncbi:tetratricopeptide repeat protein [Lentzea sp. NPDC092896]|uniref:tetratricopeptide repeat protein n=1 Tax=Lentzea sp. NPDC092896 TaxID=3364127 RepID=UPI00382D261F